MNPDDLARESLLADTFVRLADTLVRDFDVADLFDRLTSACVDLLGAATAGLMLAYPPGRLQLVTSSSDAMRTLEEFEVSSGEGPCMDAYAHRHPVSIDLRSDTARDTWPRFTAQAIDAGFTGVQALPMRLRGDTIGALNLFHTGDQRFDEHDTALAQALADVATIAILQHRSLTTSQDLAGQLQVALNDRIVIEQVKGLLAERGGVAVDTAFSMLRDYCRTARLPLTRTSRELINGERDPDDVLRARFPQPPSA